MMIYSFLYVLVFSTALVLIQKMDINIPPLFSLLCTATIATIYFNYINRKQLKKIYTDCLSNKTEWLIVMLIVLVMWITTMVGPGFIGASLFNFIYFAWLGVIGFLFLCLQNWNKNKIKFYYALCVLLLLVSNVYLELRASFSRDLLYGIEMALLGGSASFIYFKKSQSLAKTANLTATQVLAVRFYLTIFVIAMFLPHNQMQPYLTLVNFINLLILAFFSLIIPLYFSQKALENITSEQHAIINSACPIVTGVIQNLIFHDIQSSQMLIYFLYTLAIGGFYIINKYSQKLKFSNQ